MFKGTEYKFSWFFKTLDAQQVAQRIFEAIQKNEKVN